MSIRTRERKAEHEIEECRDDITKVLSWWLDGR